MLHLLRHLDSLGARTDMVHLGAAPGLQPIETAHLMRSAEEQHDYLRSFSALRRADGPPVLLTPTACDLLDDVQDKLDGPAHRRRGARQALLLWLDEVDDFVESVDDFPADRYPYYGEPFTKEVIVRAAKYLHDQGLAEGTLKANGTLVIARITPAGQAVVEDHDGDVTAARAPRQVSNVSHVQNFTQSVIGQNAQGDYNTLHQAIVADVAALEGLLSSIRDLVQRVPESGDRDDLELAIDDVEAAANNGDAADLDRRGARLRRATERVVEGIATQVGVQAAGPVTTELTLQVRQLLQLVGWAP